MRQPQMMLETTDVVFPSRGSFFVGWRKYSDVTQCQGVLEWGCHETVDFEVGQARQVAID